MALHSVIRIVCHEFEPIAASYNEIDTVCFSSVQQVPLCLQCFDAVGWVAGRDKGLFNGCVCVFVSSVQQDAIFTDN